MTDGALGEKVCALADQVNARAVVLLPSDKDMITDMVYGNVTTFVTRNCKAPLVMYRQ